MEEIEIKSMNYIGSSMNQTLKSGDRLYIVPYFNKEVQKGDVVVFIAPGGDTKVVHRVVAVSSNVIKTRGDNCNHADDWVLGREHIIGRVVSLQRRNRRLRVFGGRLGHSLAMVIRGIRSFDSIFCPLLRPFYRRLAEGGAFRRWLPSRMRPRVISFNRDSGTELQLVMGRRVIGRRLEGKTGWHIQRPYRLFVDEESLPENKAKVSGVGFQVSAGNEEL
jgi:hypothetical protein